MYLVKEESVPYRNGNERTVSGQQVFLEWIDLRRLSLVALEHPHPHSHTHKKKNKIKNKNKTVSVSSNLKGLKVLSFNLQFPVWSLHNSNTLLILFRFHNV